jgi:ATP-dependent exoDNAse (exonuclease V) beta subunit
LAVAEDPVSCAAAAAVEIERILREETVRDRDTGVRRQARPGDIAILFRSRATHREFEHELEIRGISAYVYKGLGFFDADEIKDLSSLIRYLADPGSDLRAAAFLRSRFVRISDKGLAQLGHLAAAIASPELPAAAALLGDEDRRVLQHVRVQAREWLARVDRVPPADLLEQLLAETAYAYETRGPRRQQAWENIKKMRGLVRRIQNRGYATLARIADHIDSLTAGDESNAVIEALDAVNLMTIHAAKGLEFPVVFVVNLGKGANGPSRPVRVTVDGEGGEPSVSVGPFVSETDEAERDREKHETRRLMYVAVTRARDRLYLSSALRDGVVQAPRGSLAEVLPDSLRQLFACAATAVDERATVGWAGPSGRLFEWRICRVPNPQRGDAAPFGPAEAVARESRVDRLDAVRDESAVRRVPLTRWLAELHGSAEPRVAGVGDATTGTLVHRLFQFSERVSGCAGVEAESAHARALLKPEERAVLEDVDATVASALDAWRSLRTRDDVTALFASGRRLHEVPFSLRVDATTLPGGTPSGRVVLRGTIDCLVQREDGSIVVIELKTGRRRIQHQEQLDLYVEAARALFPKSRVEGRLIYAD